MPNTCAPTRILPRITTDPRIATLYSQAAGLASFLLESDGGRYREAVVDYMQAIYGNKDMATTLAQVTGRSFAELDAEYQAYIAGLPQPLPVP